MDLSKLTKAELIALLQQQAAVPATVPAMPQGASAESPAPAPAPSPVDELVRALTGALVASREMPKNDESTYRVENVAGCSIAFTVLDDRTGATKFYRLEKRGDHAKLTGHQVNELREKHAHFFDDGYLAVPGVVEESVNTIRDPQKFLDSLTFETVNARIEEITSPASLWTLYNFIETLRFTHLDETGRPLTETDAATGQDYFVMRERSIDPKYLATAMAVQRRIGALTGVRARLDG
jgi:hypothetical protein